MEGIRPIFPAPAGGMSLAKVPEMLDAYGPDVVLLSDLRHRQNAIMAQLVKGPVILTQHGRGTAVLLSMQQWQEINECLRSMADAQALRTLYAEFDEEERDLARAGLGHYADTLRKDEARQNEGRE